MKFKDITYSVLISLIYAMFILIVVGIFIILAILPVILAVRYTLWWLSTYIIIVPLLIIITLESIDIFTK